VNLLKFLGAAVVGGPFGGGIAYVSWTGTTQATDGVVAILSYVLGSSLALTCLVMLTHLFLRAARHPWGSRVCASCLSDVPAQASVCRYCQRDLASGVAMSTTSTTGMAGLGS